MHIPALRSDLADLEPVTGECWMEETAPKQKTTAARSPEPIQTWGNGRDSFHASTPDPVGLFGAVPLTNDVSTFHYMADSPETEFSLCWNFVPPGWCSTFPCKGVDWDITKRASAKCCISGCSFWFRKQKEVSNWGGWGGVISTVVSSSGWNQVTGSCR